MYAKPMAPVFAATLLVSLFGAPVGAQQAADEVAPESGKQVGIPKSPVLRAKKWMVAVANPHAAEAAAGILRAGGSAADAAVAAQAMLGLVEPQSSGLGGGAFLVYFDAASGKVTTLDGRETAPAGVTPQLFQDENGEPLKFFDAVVGGRSVGVPGTPALMEAMHRKWGKLKFGRLLQPAIELAEKGFEVSPRLADLTTESAEYLAMQETAANYFLPGGEPLAAGATLSNSAYADTLRLLARGGARAFYRGPMARSIAAAVRSFTANPGTLTTGDMAAYRVKERPAICVDYRQHDVCGMGPPSSGALTVGQILSMLSHYDLQGLGPDDLDTWRLIGDASRLAFADRGRYMADSDFVPMPVKGLVDPEYLEGRAQLLARKDALPKDAVEAGEPAWDHAALQADDEALELPSTSHFSIIDEAGNAVSMTTTIENAFGSRLMVGGFLLNNELTDFSFRTHREGIPIANRVEPGKRPRSSMAPTIVLKEGKPLLLIGSPGGSRIIGYVAKTIVAVIDWDLDIQKAIEMPHLVNRFGTYDIEAGTDAEKFAPGLETLGYEVNMRDLNSGLHGISVLPDGYLGGADPRREGVVIGE